MKNIPTDLLFVPEVLASCLALLFLTMCQLQAAAPERGFISRQPASTWEHALVTGGGLHGAMVYGQPADETIILNHGRLYMPLHEPLPAPDTAPLLPEIRRLMADGEYQRAAELVVTTASNDGYSGKRWTDPYIPACDLKILMPTKGSVADYQRSVNFATGVAAVEWSDERGRFTRRVFASRADDLVAVSITGPGQGAVDCQLRLATRPAAGQGGWDSEQAFENGVKETAAKADEGFLTYQAGFRQSWPGSLRGYEVAARVVTTGGVASTEGDTIRVTGADEVLVLLRVGLVGESKPPRLAQSKTDLGGQSGTFDQLLARHTAIHGPMFLRTRLDLGGGGDRTLPSEELLEKSSVESPSPKLLEKLFDAGRYAVLSSSGEVFPNLQGIWNGTWGPPWSADFTLNGNVQCALAANLSGNLAECLLPFFDFLEEHLPESRENARRLYGCRGIHLASRASTHGRNNHFDATWPMTFWTAGAAWASQFYHDYALYTGDREFLANRAVPFMKEAALFYEDFLIEGADGKLLFSPSYSPENNPANSPSQACINATMDVAAARELLTNLIADCQQLGIEAEGVHRWQAMLAKLPTYQINADGAVAEWATPLLLDNYAHRHVSHLYPLFAGLPAEIAADQALQQAFRLALEKRMEVRRRENGGVMAFGLVQMGLAAASLRDAGMACETVDWLANKFWNNNLVSTHNPNEIFNTDICGGLPAVILAMLVDSGPGRIDLIPALPEQWPSGQVEGVRCRGNVVIRSLRWTPERLDVDLVSGTDQTVMISQSGQPEARKIRLPANEEIRVSMARARGQSE